MAYVKIKILAHFCIYVDNLGNIVFESIICSVSLVNLTKNDIFKFINTINKHIFDYIHAY